MFSKPEKKPEPPKIYFVRTEDEGCNDGEIKGAFLNEEEAEKAAEEKNKEHAPEFKPYFVDELEIIGESHEWHRLCPVCQAREAFYKKTEDDLK